MKIILISLFRLYKDILHIFSCILVVSGCFGVWPNVSSRSCRIVTILNFKLDTNTQENIQYDIIFNTAAVPPSLFFPLLFHYFLLNKKLTLSFAISVSIVSLHSLQCISSSLTGEDSPPPSSLTTHTRALRQRRKRVERREECCR